MASTSLRSRLALVAAGLLLAANGAVPVVWGDVYPFTSAPMFREAPVQCCQYRVFDAAGRELPPENWLLQRVYDGNPVGYGVGVRPPTVLEQEFGVVHGAEDLRRHVAKQFERDANRGYQRVAVEQNVIGATDNGRVGEVQTSRSTMERP